MSVSEAQRGPRPAYHLFPIELLRLNDTEEVQERASITLNLIYMYLC